MQDPISHLCQMLIQLLRHRAQVCSAHSLLQKLGKYILIRYKSGTVLSPGDTETDETVPVLKKLAAWGPARQGAWQVIQRNLQNQR